MNIEKQIKIYLASMFLILAGIIFVLSNSLIEPYVSDFFTQHIIKNSNKQKDIGSNDIVLVVIDEESLNEYRWPWSRSQYKVIFDFLEHKAGAKVVLFDAVVTSQDPDRLKDDIDFYKYLKTADKLVLGFDLCKGGKNAEPCKVIQKNLYPIFNKKFDINIINKRRYIPNTGSYTGIMYMQPEFLESAKAFGNVIVMDKETDKITNDRIIRTYSNLVFYNNKYYPSLALSGYAKIYNDKNYILTADKLFSEKGKLLIKFPLNAQRAQSNYTYLKWYKPYKNSSYYTHKAYSAGDVYKLANKIKNGEEAFIRSANGEIITPELFKDKIVFVGANASAQSLNDKFGTPVLVRHAGVDIQATALNNYIDNISSKKAITIVNILIAAILLFISFIFICNFNPVVSLTANIIVVLIYFFIYYKFLQNDYIINFITIIFLEILLFAFTYIYRFTKEGEKKDKIQSAMGKYLSDDVMKKVVSSIDSLSLGGKKTQASIMFIDIRKFTSISENMEADEVSELLNEYFSTIYPIIKKNHGILNKFIGDAVLVIFEGEYHAENSIICADSVLLAVKDLQQKWLKKGRPKIDVGVGINSGEVFIGNIGTKDRMEYTVIGDTVNTASRIEGYNKIYKTKFLIGENTYNIVKQYVDVIKINEVALRGKSQKINIYEIIRVNKK